MTNNDDLFYIAITYYIAINKNTEARFGRRGYHYLVPETTTWYGHSTVPTIISEHPFGFLVVGNRGIQHPPAWSSINIMFKISFSTCK
jgi:hypothetical protein